MVTLSVPSLSTIHILAAKPRPLEDFDTKARKLDKDTGAPLTRYTFASFGEYGIEQIVVKAPEVPGCEDWTPGARVEVSGVTALLYKPENGKSLSAVSLSAQAVALADEGKGGKTS